MTNSISNTKPMRVSSLLIITILSIAAFVTNGCAIGSFLPSAMATINASSPSSSDSSIVAAVITITENAEGNTVFRPETTNITQGAEIFIGNNSSSPQSITSGTGPEDTLSGNLFDTGVIESKGYAEFVTSNLDPGTYPIYSSTDPSVKGSIVVQK